MTSEHISPGPAPKGKVRCSLCDAEVSKTATSCWLCHEPLSTAIAAGDVRLTRADTDTPNIRRPLLREDNAVFLFVGVLAVLICIGMAIEVPGVLVGLLILATPAFIRAAIGMSRQEGPEKGLAGIGLFFSSLGIITMIGVATGAAFFATCFAVCMGGLALENVGGHHVMDWLAIPAIGAGIGMGLVVFIRLLMRFWPQRG